MLSPFIKLMRSKSKSWPYITQPPLNLYCPRGHVKKTWRFPIGSLILGVPSITLRNDGSATKRLYSGLACWWPKLYSRQSHYPPWLVWKISKPHEPSVLSSAFLTLTNVNSSICFNRISDFSFRFLKVLEGTPRGVVGVSGSICLMYQRSSKLWVMEKGSTLFTP